MLIRRIVSVLCECLMSNLPSTLMWPGSLLKVDDAELLIKRATESPHFVFPIRRDGGHFMLYSQFSTTDSMFVLSDTGGIQTHAATSLATLAVPTVSAALRLSCLPYDSSSCRFG